MCDAVAAVACPRHLALSNNQLSGSIPTALGSLSALRWVVHRPQQQHVYRRSSTLRSLCRTLRSGLALESNQLQGGIPFSIGSIVSLSSLTLDHNGVSEMPQSLLSLVALRYDQTAVAARPRCVRRRCLRVIITAARCRTLSLCNNSFNGPLPAFMLNATWIT
jgi:hypothetical protein